MVLGKQIIIENNCFFPIFVKDNYKDKLLKNLESYMDKLQNNNIILDYDMCSLNCNYFKRATYFIHHDLEKNFTSKKIYNIYIIIKDGEKDSKLYNKYLKYKINILD